MTDPTPIDPTSADPTPATSDPKPPLKVGVIGTGALGRHHVRILAEMPEAELVGIHDTRPEVAQGLAEAHGTKAFDRFEMLADEVEAVVLAVPTSAHAEIGCWLLERGIHVQVEKPLTRTLEEADQLLDAAAKAPGDPVLAVGHVEFYNPAVQALLGLGERARYVEIQRLSPFTPRSLDIDVLLDLMIHDLQILHALDPSTVAEIRATGIEVLSPKIDMTCARIALESGLVANITASRVSAEPVRKLRAFLESRYCSIDYRDQVVKGYGLKHEGEQRLIVPADPKVETIERREPLRVENEVFVAVCRGEEKRYVDGKEGRRALATALAIRKEIARPG